MFEADRKEFAAELQRAFRFFGQKPPDAEITADWFDAMKDVHLEDVRRGLAEHKRFSKFTPKPADIRKRAYGSEEGSRSTVRKWHCGYTSPSGGRCPLVAIVSDDEGYHCSGHHNPDNEQAAEEHYRMAVENRLPPPKPSIGELMMAEAMMALDGEERTRIAWGNNVMHWIRKNAAMKKPAP